MPPNLNKLSGQNDSGANKNNEDKGICLSPEEMICGRINLLVLQLTIKNW